MKFKVDDNLPVDVCQLLQQAGYDCMSMSVYDQKMTGATGYTADGLPIRRAYYAHIGPGF